MEIGCKGPEARSDNSLAVCMRNPARITSIAKDVLVREID